MKLYVSGPMTGLPHFNFPAFHAAAAALRLKGYEVVCPAELPEPSDHDGGPLPAGSQSWQWYLRRDLAAMLECEGVATLYGWNGSKVARLEVHVAVELGMPVLQVDQW